MEFPPALARQCARPLPAGWPTGLLPPPLHTALMQTLRRAPYEPWLGWLRTKGLEGVNRA